MTKHDQLSFINLLLAQPLWITPLLTLFLHHGKRPSTLMPSLRFAEVKCCWCHCWWPVSSTAWFISWTPKTRHPAATTDCHMDWWLLKPWRVMEETSVVDDFLLANGCWLLVVTCSYLLWLTSNSSWLTNIYLLNVVDGNWPHLLYPQSRNSWLVRTCFWWCLIWNMNLSTTTRSKMVSTINSHTVASTTDGLVVNYQLVDNAYQPSLPAILHC